METFADLPSCGSRQLSLFLYERIRKVRIFWENILRGRRFGTGEKVLFEVETTVLQNTRNKEWQVRLTIYDARSLFIVYNGTAGIFLRMPEV